MAVGAVDQQNEPANFSSVGRELELMAPGVTIKSTIPSGYGSNSGTLMTAPHVAGVESLLWEDKQEFDNVQVRNAYIRQLTDSFYFGNGLVDCFGFIQFIA
jgi:subtilisin family serine protease